MKRKITDTIRAVWTVIGVALLLYIWMKKSSFNEEHPVLKIAVIYILFSPVMALVVYKIKNKGER